LEVPDLDLFKLMRKLAKARPLFHSEKDFRDSFGKSLARLYPDCFTIRYEAQGFYPGSEKVDILAVCRGLTLGIELKYKWVTVGDTSRLMHAGEQYQPPKSGAPDDITRFAFLDDIQRLESVTMNRSDVVGYAILLSNKHGLWSPPRYKEPNDLMFRIHGPTIGGRLIWKGNPAKKTLQATGESITLRRVYNLEWRPYAQVRDARNGLFQYLAVRTGQNGDG